MTFSLSIPFDGRESIDNYHVTPPTVPCGSPMSSRNQVQYQCSGLMVGQVYGFTVRAVNCENQQGPESGTITVTPQGEILLWIMSAIFCYFSLICGQFILFSGRAFKWRKLQLYTRYVCVRSLTANRKIDYRAGCDNQLANCCSYVSCIRSHNP